VTVADVEAKVEAIRAVRGDDERAHSDEDELHQLVLAVIARGAANAAELAAAALKTTEIEFSRWCA
jgi:hypothetical protein